MSSPPCTDAMIEEMEPKDMSCLLSPTNLLATVTDGKVVLEKDKLQAIINQAVEKDESLKSLPVVIVSVLGEDNDDWRKQCTDWIIHHHENDEKTSLPSETKTPNFLFFGDKSEDTKGQAYIWPRPFKLKSTNMELLGWIVYADGDDIEMLDMFVACASSKIVVSKANETEKILKLVKSTNIAEYSAKFNFAMPLGRITTGCKIRDFGQKFLDSGYNRNKDISPKRKHSDNEIVTLENFEGHLEEIAGTVNGMDHKTDKISTSKTTGKAEKHDSSLSTEQGSPSSLEQGGAASLLNEGSPSFLEQGVPPPGKQGAASLLDEGTPSPLDKGTPSPVEQGSPSSFEQKCQSSAEQVAPLAGKEVNPLFQEQEDTHPVGKERTPSGEQGAPLLREGKALLPAEDEGASSAKSNDLLATKSEDSSPRTSVEKAHTAPINQVSHPLVDISEQMNIWINTIMTLQNIDKMTCSFDIQDKKINEDMLAYQNMLVSFNYELRNMFDNYVCFFGKDDDGKKMKNFANIAIDRLSKKYKSIFGSPSHSIFHIGTLSTITNKLYKNYVHDNEKIVEQEKTLSQNITGKILAAYIDSMTSIVNKKEKNVKLGELEDAHKRLVHTAIGTITRCMDYGGRLNSVLGAATHDLETSIDEEFNKIKRENKIRPDLELPSNEAMINIASYLAKMSELEEHLTKFSSKELYDFHNVWKENLKETSETDELPLRLDSYLTYLLERKREQNEIFINTSNISGKQPRNTLCIYIKSDRVHVLGKYNSDTNKSQVVSNLENPLGISAKVAWNDPNDIVVGTPLENLTEKELKDYKVVGNISNFINDQENSKMAANVLTSFLAHLKLKHENNITGIEFNQAVVIIPSTFGMSGRQRIRNSAVKAKFQYTFICNESSLLAYHFVNDKNVGKQDQAPLLIVTDVRNTGSRVEIFESTKKYEAEKISAIRMLGLAEQNWDSKLKPEKSSQPPGNFSGILQTTLERSLSQLPPSKQKLRKQHFVICENVDWKKAVIECFENAGDDNVHVSSQHMDVLKVAAAFFNEPSEFRNKILDFALHVPDEEEDQGHEMENRSSLIPPEKEKEIVHKCDMVEQQIKEGKVKLGVINKRISLETVERTRNALSVGMSFEAEEGELNEIIKQHKFKHLVNSCFVNSGERHALLLKCEKMEQQIANGKVKMGVLIKRLVLEVTSRTKDAVTEGTSYKDDEAELNDTILQHKFKI